MINNASRSRALKVVRIIDVARGESLITLQEIADHLNEKSIRTPRGCEWTRTSVSRVLKVVGVSE